MDSHGYFNDIAKNWNKIRSLYFKDDIRPLMRRVLSFTDKTVIDLGSGTGFIAHEAAKSAKVVFALDQSANMLQTIVKPGDKNIVPVLSAMDAIPFPDESADIVTINMALHHVINPLGLIKEVSRVLKPGGEFFISDVTKHDAKWAHTEMFDVWLGFTLKEIEDWLHAAGFTPSYLVDTGLKATATNKNNETLTTHIFMAIARKERQ